MYCWNCGKEMEDDLLFCPHCAMKQAGIPEPKPERKRKIPLLVIVCGAVCMAILLGMILIFSAGGAVKEPQKPVDPYSVVLPDPASFLNTRYTRDDTSAYTHYVTWEMKKTTGRKALQEFVELLQEDCYQLVLDNSWDYSQDQALCTDYIFRYTGKGEGIKWVSHKDGYRYHAKLSIHEHKTKDQITVVFYTAPGLLLEDPGVDANAVS